MAQSSNVSNVTFHTGRTENTTLNIEQTRRALSSEGRHMLEALASYDLDLIEVDLDGYGDEGLVPEVRLLRSGVEVDPVLRPEHRDLLNIFLSDEPWIPRTFRLLIELIAWDVIAEAGLDGWETEGGFGQILIYPKELRISIGMITYKTMVTFYSRELSVDIEKNAHG